MPQDFDGDGKADLAITRTTNGNPLQWWILQSRDGIRVENFGFGGNATPVGDYDGDGKADLAVAFPIGGQGNPYNFSIKKSSDGGTINGVIGSFPNDVVMPGDYDGDGKTDIAVVNKLGDFANYNWQWIRSSDGGRRSMRFGTSLDNTVPGDYDGDGTTDIAVYRREAGFGAFWVNGSTMGLKVFIFGNGNQGGIQFY